MYSDVPSLFVNTGLEYPEIQKFAMKQKNMVDGKWQPNKQGLGLGKVLDFINVKY